jgi:hypothetical protein
MRNISVITLDGGPDSIAQATSWAQKGLEVVNSTVTRQSKKEDRLVCDLACLSLMYHLSWMQMVSSFFSFLFAIFKFYSSYGANTTMAISRSNLFWN